MLHAMVQLADWQRLSRLDSHQNDLVRRAVLISI